MQPAKDFNIVKFQRQAARKEKDEAIQIANAERVAAGGNPIITSEDLRDTCLSLLRNEFGSGDGMAERVQAAGGSSKSTIKAWLEHKVKNPQMRTLRANLRTVGKDLGIVEYKGESDEG
jgi:integrase